MENKNTKSQKISEQQEEQQYIWYSAKDYCALRCINRSTLWRWQKAGKIKTKIERHITYVAVKKGEFVINKDNKFVLFDNFEPLK